MSRLFPSTSFRGAKGDTFLAVWLVLHASIAAADWPQFRGPTGQGIAQAKNVPSQWSESRNIAWRTPLVGNGWSSPIVVDQAIYLTAAVPVEDKPGDFDLCALAYDLDNGQELWRTNIFRQDAEAAPRIHSKNSHASPTPLVEEGRLYVHFGHMGTACLDLEGKVLWKNDRISYEPVHGNGGSPALVGQALIYSCDGASDPFVIALDKRTGKTLWKTARPPNDDKQFAFCTPLAIDVNGQTQVVLPGAGAVCAYDPQTGNELWHAHYDGYSVIPRPVFGHGLVFLSSGYDSPSVLAIRPDGRGDVTKTHVAWTVSKGAPHTPSLLVVGKELYMVSDRGIATCLDAISGEQIWQQRLGGNFSASPILADGRLYFLDENGTCHVLAPGRDFQKLAENHLPERTLASPAVIDGALILRGDKHLYRVGRD